MQFLWALGLLVASYFIQSLVTQNKSTKPERAGLKDFDFPQVEEGTPQIVVFGDVWIEDWTVLWYGRMRTSSIKAKGGKK